MGAFKRIHIRFFCRTRLKEYLHIYFCLLRSAYNLPCTKIILFKIYFYQINVTRLGEPYGHCTASGSERFRRKYNMTYSKTVYMLILCSRTKWFMHLIEYCFSHFEEMRYGNTQPTRYDWHTVAIRIHNRCQLIKLISRLRISARFSHIFSKCH